MKPLTLCPPNRVNGKELEKNDTGQATHDTTQSQRTNQTIPYAMLEQLTSIFSIANKSKGALLFTI